ncbi:katanin p80 WD40 repeat-containing subunit B1 isoform X1 [Astyanax mexicanus]|uniref:katanin p80 WD40 repeat-containing subunit B1 isoform X1 n=1 Tax=Astyanax mexicanus TaxID=7994 RepID=UPI0020CB2A50|nr:katanin p80 WD40 repeat-containing subunit B1 isoform X1 [Astyanax mexicanus]XP_022542219.2 katanin p80 WD40 repeat-containing subunit B1 isoform X1 [Astyanax mexicanus]
MAASDVTKMWWKLQDMVAHSSKVSSLVLGRSGRLLATGGEDCRVNIWAVNKPNCIMSLTGHTSPLQCVQFSSTEEQVVAGSESGSLRVWDLEAAKILRTLMGHKANICSLDFHPFGEHIASGSVDTNIKLWDVRRKGCVFRYKGHTQAVRCISFSPDGKWLASASDDSTIKLWDLTAGKLITEFTAHTSAVNVVQFHPNEYLLASGSADRTVKLWDLEKFKLIGSSEGETGPVRCMLFSPDGSCLYSGSEDALRVYGWEPDRCFDVVHVGWGKVADFAICNSQMIGVSCSQMNVSSYVVDLSRVKTSGSVIQGLIEDDKPLAAPTSKGPTLRRNYERPATTCNTQKMKQHSDADRRSPEGERRSPSSDDEHDDKESNAEITNPDDYKEIFQPRNAICETSLRTPPKKSEPFPAPFVEERYPVKPSPAAEVFTPIPDKLKASNATSTPILRVEPTVVASTSARPVSVVTASVALPSRNIVPTSKQKPSPVVIPSACNELVGLNVGDFLPPTRTGKTSVTADDEALNQIRKGHETMCVMLTSRHKNLDTVRTVWTGGDIKTSLDSAVSINDLSIVVDILNIVNLKPSLWKLDTCTTILPQIEELLQSKYESYVQTGYVSLKLILKRFWPLISETLTALPSVGVDITREERHQKCKACYKQLKNLSNIIKNRAEQVGRHGSTFKELQLLMAPLDY